MDQPDPSKVEDLQPRSSPEPSKVEDLQPRSSPEPSKVEDLQPQSSPKPSKVEDLQPQSSPEPSKVEDLQPRVSPEPSKVEDLQPRSSPEPSKVEDLQPQSSPEPSKVEDLQPQSSPNSRVDVSDIKTIKVSNVSLAISDIDIFEFFSFSGDIDYIEMQRESETTQVAYVTFRESQGADTAILLTGAVIRGLPASINRVENYQLPPDAVPYNPERNPTTEPSAVQRAEDVVSTMLAKGFVLGKDALNKAKALDEKHKLTSNATATVASLNRKIGLSEKLSNGKAVVNGKVQEMDERFQVSEITKSALAAAELTANSIMSNRYVSSGAAWFTSAMNRVSKAAEDVSAMTKEKVEKVEKAEGEKRGVLEKEREVVAHNNSDTIPAASRAIGVDSGNDNTTNKVV